MSEHFDVIIIGLGAMGSAACYQLAKSGKRVLGIDRFTPPHTFGSSHGQTRIIREAYFEHPVYVPLVQRAYELWSELERESNRQLFLKTGGLMIGRPEGIVFGGAKKSAEEHHLAHQILTAAEVREQFPALQPHDGMAAVWEPRAGILFPELCIDTHITLARKHGANIVLNEPVLEWKAQAGAVRVQTEKANYDSDRLIISAGPWASTLLPDLQKHLKIERQVLYWFEPRADAGIFSPKRCPIHLWEYANDRFFYGFPDLGEGVKIARHHEGDFTTAEAVDRTVGAHEIADMRDLMRRFQPKAEGVFKSATVCLYTDTPDGHFLIDHHPEHPQVIIASPCSGHGFKFSSAVGEVLAELATGTKPRIDLSLFSYARLRSF
jgi:sarcosine oxidase